MSKSESASAYLRRVTNTETLADAKKILDRALTISSNQSQALEKLGTITIVVIPVGAYTYMLSPNLIANIEALDSADKALSDVKEYVRNIRKQIIQKEVEQRASDIIKQQQEETDG